MKNHKYNLTNTVSDFASYVSTFMLRYNVSSERVAQFIKDTRDGIVSRYNLAISLCVAFVNMLRSESALFLHWCATKIAPTAEIVTAEFPAWDRPEGGFETLTMSNGTTFGVYFPPAEVPAAPPAALPITQEDETPALVLTFNENVASELMAKYDRETTDSPSDHVETRQTHAQSEDEDVRLALIAPPTLVAHTRRERVSKDKRRIDYKPAKDVQPGATYWYKVDGRWQELVAPEVEALAA